MKYRIIYSKSSSDYGAFHTSNGLEAALEIANNLLGHGYDVGIWEYDEANRILKRKIR